MGTVSASDRFGWLLVKGKSTTAIGTSNVSDGGTLVGGASTNAGWVDQVTLSSDSGNVIYGAWGRAAGTSATTITFGDDSSGNYCTVTVQLHYPFVTGVTHGLSSGLSS